MATGNKTAEDVLSRVERHLNPGLARVFRFMGLETFEVSGEGVWVTDALGDRYLDFSSGYGVMVHGYRHPKIVEAAKRQLDKMAMSSRVLPTREAADLAELLAEVTPGDLRYTFFSNSGAESVEAALKFARLATHRTKVIATEGAFHGKTMGALTLSGRDMYRLPFAPLVPEIVHVPFGDANAAEEAIDETTAAFITEPIQGEGGIRVPPDGYLRDLREMTRRKGALLIMDEVQSGMGRTGKLWAFEHEGIVPDLMTAAKALGGGIIPLGATVGTPEAMGFFDEKPLIHTSTFGGNPLAAAVGQAAIRVLLEEELPQRAEIQGGKILAFGKLLQERYPRVIKEVRGRGLMIGVEVQSEGIGGAMMAEIISRKMLVVYTLNNPLVLRLMPPLTIGDDELASGMERLEESIQAVDEIVEDL